MEVSIIFPHQLYQQNPALRKGTPVFLVEEWLYFNQYKFHQQKIVLHRASMQFYKQWLIQQGFDVTYIEAIDEKCDSRKLLQHLALQEKTTIHYADVVDNWLEKRLLNTAKKLNLQLVKYTTPNFLNKLTEVADFFDKKATYFQTDFYTWQRKQRQILLEKDGKPLGGKWTFDADNRNKFAKNEIVPTYPFPNENEFVKEARTYVAAHFNHNYGNAASPFKVLNSFYPTTFTEAENWLQSFLQQRFSKFGIYEDAMVAKESILYHSVLTPMLNIGLLTPQQILDATLDIASTQDIPLNSLEGFIRQIMGWREFIRIVYEREGTLQRTKNYWGFSRKIPGSFYNGTTGIVPIDNVIKKLLQSGYNHHIERLMVLGNFMLLCEFDPNEVHKWFMEMYVDSYDWVMVPNVYGMTQFADGGLMTTKPYISGSNYIMKMSDYEKGDWQAIWDGLFWRFMHVHRSFFLQNPRLGMLIGTFDKMSEEKRQNHLNNAEAFLNQL
ncbi:MAG: cryptochrome/photolyase family protein [Deinococcales bacterium]|nr:cryptochrome/photolyase family protein [Chitinophagaceae bacterium]